MVFEKINFMKLRFHYVVIILLSVVLISASCRGGKVFCGCPNEQGISGFK